jgi:phosphopantothenoylcysteine decarboxylase/phosphopantothenate--cysteine ligase
VSRVLLCVGASVAIYKACDLASRLSQSGHEVRTLLTEAAARLVHPQLFESITGGPAASSEFGPERRKAMDHIEFARFAELVVVAPCTADLAARLALGLADDLVTTAVLALAPGLPRLLCPAANPSMLAQPAVERNLARLREDGWEVIEAEEGHMACGEEGRGRLAAPERIVAAIQRRLPR